MMNLHERMLPTSAGNEQGQNLLDFCIEGKLRILNGRHMRDSVAYKTFYGPRGSSSIDYKLVSKELLHRFDFINVMPPADLFDYFVVWFAMNIGNNYCGT